MNEVRGGVMLQPGPMFAIAILLVNDHWAKAAYPGWITGKLSDVAGLAFFPLLLVALAELAGAPATRRGLAVSCLATAAVFAAAKLWPPANDAVRLAFGLAQWPVRGLAALTRAQPVPAPAAVQMRLDPSDLLALPAVLLSVWWGRRLPPGR